MARALEDAVTEEAELVDGTPMVRDLEVLGFEQLTAATAEAMAAS